MNVLLTGATGFLGTKLAQELVRKGHTIYAVVRDDKKAAEWIQAFPQKDQANLHILPGDVAKPGLGISEHEIKQIDGRIDAVYHLAAFLSFDERERATTYLVNVEGTRHTLELACRIGCPRFLYVSTAYVLGDSTEAREELYSTDRTFVNHYEETKCLAEHIVAAHRDRMDVVILRPSIVIGDSVTGQAKTNFGLYGLLKGLRVLKRRASRRAGWTSNPYHIFVDVNVSSNLVPVDYVAFVLTTALTYARNGEVYNVTNPNPPTQQVVIDCLKEVLEFPNLVPVPFGYETRLTDDEVIFNQSMSVFKKYWSRSIHFPSSNTRKLLEQVNQTELKLDKKLLTHIIRGFQTGS